MESTQISRVLSRGVIIPKKISKILCIVASCLFVFIMVAVVVISDLSIEHKVIAGIAAFGLLGGIDALMIGVFINSIKLTKYVEQCLQDAVELRAYVTLWDEEIGGDIIPIEGIYRIKVEFAYENKRHVKYSPVKKSGRIVEGFNMYVNKAIRILYSPKYDEVMIPKKDWEYVKPKRKPNH